MIKETGPVATARQWWRRGGRRKMLGVRGFELPRSLACPAPGDGNEDPTWNQWIAGLPGIVDDLARRWSLRVGRPFQPGGSASWVAPARTSGGERVVLKVGFRHDEALDEAGGLRAWDGRGTVRLLDSCQRMASLRLLATAGVLAELAMAAVCRAAMSQILPVAVL